MNGPMDVQWIFTVVFVAVAVVIVIAVVRGLITVGTNLAQDVIETRATVVAKRSQVSGSSDGPVSTAYFVTFDCAQGGRMELKVSPRQFGMIGEGEAGLLSHQGTWFKGFARA
jgi:hypothetical protein